MSDEVEKKLAEELGFKVAGWDIRTPDGNGFISNNDQFTQKLWRALVSERKRTELLDAMVGAYEEICGKSHATLRTLVSKEKR
jgi:hypothetical protein